MPRCRTAKDAQQRQQQYITIYIKGTAVASYSSSHSSSSSMASYVLLAYSRHSRVKASFLTPIGPQSRFGDNWGQSTWNVSALSPKRDWSSNYNSFSGEGGQSKPSNRGLLFTTIGGKFAAGVRASRVCAHMDSAYSSTKCHAGTAVFESAFKFISTPLTSGRNRSGSTAYTRAKHILRHVHDTRTLEESCWCGRT